MGYYDSGKYGNDLYRGVKGSADGGDDAQNSNLQPAYDRTAFLTPEVERLIGGLTRLPFEVDAEGEKRYEDNVICYGCEKTFSFRDLWYVCMCFHGNKDEPEGNKSFRGVCKWCAAIGILIALWAGFEYVKLNEKIPNGHVLKKTISGQSGAKQCKIFSECAFAGLILFSIAVPVFLGILDPWSLQSGVLLFFAAWFVGIVPRL
jgi:hypothetical protein